MTIKPIIKLFFADGSKGKAELYNRPSMVILKRADGKEVSLFRCGPDEYKEHVPKLERKPLPEERMILGPDGELHK